MRTMEKLRAIELEGFGVDEHKNAYIRFCLHSKAEKKNVVYPLDLLRQSPQILFSDLKAAYSVEAINFPQGEENFVDYLKSYIAACEDEGASFGVAIKKGWSEISGEKVYVNKMGKVRNTVRFPVEVCLYGEKEWRKHFH